MMVSVAVACNGGDEPVTVTCQVKLSVAVEFWGGVYFLSAKVKPAVNDPDGPDCT
jgi:ABC-type enterochelin transport system permease subunit